MATDLSSASANVEEARRQALAALAGGGTEGLAAFQSAQDQLKAQQANAVTLASQQAAARGASGDALAQLAGIVSGGYDSRMAELEKSKGQYAARAADRKATTDSYFSQIKGALPIAQANVDRARAARGGSGSSDPLTIALRQAELESKHLLNATRRRDLGLDDGIEGNTPAINSVLKQIGGRQGGRDFLLGEARRRRDEEIERINELIAASGPGSPARWRLVEERGNLQAKDEYELAADLGEELGLPRGYAEEFVGSPTVRKNRGNAQSTLAGRYKKGTRAGIETFDYVANTLGYGKKDQKKLKSFSKKMKADVTDAEGNVIYTKGQKVNVYDELISTIEDARKEGMTVGAWNDVIKAGLKANFGHDYPVLRKIVSAMYAQALSGA